MAYFLNEDALGDSLFDFFRVLLVPTDGSSIEELLGRAMFDNPSIPILRVGHRGFQNIGMNIGVIVDTLL